jgi:hypothetical protein
MYKASTRAAKTWASALAAASTDWAVSELSTAAMILVM